MAERKASRTLVKSGPELWAECSDAASLAKHLGEFGEIRITKLEPENAVAWEGDAVSGTVRLEPAGWGTRVTLKVRDTREPRVNEPPAVEPAAVVAQAPAAAEPEPEPEPEREPGLEPDTVTPTHTAESAPRPGMLARLLAAFRRGPAPPMTESAAGSAEPDAPAGEPDPPVAELDSPDAAPEVPAPRPSGVSAEPPDRMLDAALDSLGRAHHRPYSRS
jgi:hypothetical protein